MQSRSALGSVYETHGETHSPPETLEGSFSAVSTPIFATKASFFSIFRELHDLHTFAPLQSQNFQNFAQHFGEIFEIFKLFFAKFC